MTGLTELWRLQNVVKMAQLNAEILSGITLAQLVRGDRERQE
jgi:hypothetical protein